MLEDGGRSIELTKASENIQGRIGRYVPHQKRLGSVDKKEEITCGLE